MLVIYQEVDVKNQCSKGRFYNCSEITTFRELIQHIAYDWGYDPKNLIKLKDGEFQVNKTTIGKDFVDYKTEYSPLKEGVFEKLEKFYELLKE